MWVCVSVKQIKRRWGEHAHVSTNALVCACSRKGQWGQYWHAIFWAHGAAAGARPGVLRFPQRPPLWWPASAHCHPDSTSVNMLKPLLLVSSSKPKEMKPLSLQSKLDKQELGAYSLSLFLQVFRADVHQLSQASSNSWLLLLGDAKLDW